MDDPLYLLMQEQITLIALLVVGAGVMVGAVLVVLFRQYYAPGAFTRLVELGGLAETLKCLDSIDFK